MHVAMSLGFDTTVIVRRWQNLRYHNKIIGGASPNHSLDIGNKLKEDMVEFLRFCVDGNTGGVASEVKVAIL